MPALFRFARIARPGGFKRLLAARKIHRSAMDKLREQQRWRNGVYALDKPTGTAIVFARGFGGDVLELHTVVDGQTVATPIDIGSLTRSPATTVLTVILGLSRIESNMELREYDYPARTVGALISGPPVS